MVSQQTYWTLRDEWMPPLPPIEGGEYLVAYLLEIGPAVAAGMGAGPLEWRHINEWSAGTGIQLTVWECRTLIRLSKEYLAESSKASKHFAPAPWVPEGDL